FIETMMTGVFKRNYLIGDRVKALPNRFTIKMTEDLKADRAFSLFTGILHMFNVTATAKENTYVFDLSPKKLTATMRGALVYGRSIPPELSLRAVDEVTMLVPFYNIEPGTLKGVLDKLLPPQAVMLPLPALNLLVINGNYQDVKYTLSFIDLLDRAQFKEKSILMITPEYWDIEDFQYKVQELMAAEGVLPEI
ncbi:MAG: hypothetical protein GY771_04330, partial [bacterium]|nr:hypothetical protein [bacterium]